MTEGKTIRLNWLPLLGVLFVALKLTDHIDWSWWWVTLPFWFGYAIVLAFMALAMVFGLFGVVVVWLESRK